MQERPYICGLCGDTFAQKDDLLVHTASHSNTSIIRPSDTAGPSGTAMVATAKLAASSASCDVSPPEQPPALPSNNRAASAGPQTPSGVPGGSSSATATASASVPRLGSGSPTRTVVFQTFPSASTSVSGVALPEVGPRKRCRSPGHDASLSTSPQAKRATFTRSPHAGVPREMSPCLDEVALHSSSSGPSGLSGPVEDSAAAERPHPDQSRLLAASHRPAGSWVSGRRPSHNGENAPSDTTSAPAGPRNESRPQGREARGSERSRERRPTICRQEEIEIGDQDLAAEDFVDDDDAVFADRVHSHGGNDGLKGGGVVVSQLAAPATGESGPGPGPDPSQPQSSVSVKSSVTVVDSASAAAGEEKREVSGGSACSVSAGETALPAETCPSEAVPPGSVKPFQPVPRQEPPERLRCDKDGHCQSAFVFRADRKAPELGNSQSLGGAHAGAPHSLLDASQGPEAAAQASAICAGGSLGTAAPPDLCAASHSGVLTEAGSRGTSSSATLRQTHASLPLPLPLPPNQPPRPSSADKAEAADRADAATQDELMDSEVQSYFADHVDVDSPSISSAILLNDGDAAAILMNDRDSDDPQLLVCEEEMAESWKDSGSDMEEGGGEGGNLGAKHTEWDEWGSLGVPMQTSENEPDLAPPQAGILNQQRM